jgi:type VI secretion system protein ImpM
MTPVVAVGFFGKLPARGDFVRAGLSRRFTDRWDGWLQQVLPTCRQLIGIDWDQTWRTAPTWRFALAGTAPVLGLLMTSIDRAGRHFPLTIAAEGADTGSISFLDAAEQAGRAAIDQELAPDMLMAWLKAIAPPAAAGLPIADAATRWWTAAGEPVPLDGLPDAVAFARMLAR